MSSTNKSLYLIEEEVVGRGRDDNRDGTASAEEDGLLRASDMSFATTSSDGEQRYAFDDFEDDLHAFSDSSSEDDSDEDVEHHYARRRRPPPPYLESNAPCVGWRFPQVKLNSWEPESTIQWQKDQGHAIAFRNLISSMCNLMAGFGVWLVWSVVVAKIQFLHDADRNAYAFSEWGELNPQQHRALLYSLPAIAGLSGGTMRIVNSFVTQISGGRNVAYMTSIFLAIPMMVVAAVGNDPNVPFFVLLVAAWLSGTGGGAFASSMSNISFFYPKARQGKALGFNGGVGNMGVTVSQLLLPLFMGVSFGNAPPVAGEESWPAHAGWFWWPLCLIGSLMAFVWQSNHPDHGNQKQTIAARSTPGADEASRSADEDDNISYYSSSTAIITKNRCTRSVNFWNVADYLWMEISALGVAMVGILIMVYTRDAPSFNSTNTGKVSSKFILVFIVAVLEHFVIWFANRRSVRQNVREQAVIFRDKHTYIMTFLYIMSFGSFIGYSGAFPKLIVDLFGYIQLEGCMIDGDISPGGSEDECIALGGFWDQIEVTNPNAPNVFSYAWMGPAVGSLIRPVGGMLADKFGGARVTMVLIIWCAIAAICQGVWIQQKLVNNNSNLEGGGGANQPRSEQHFGVFLFLFINLFLTTGAMNGSTFRTIAVLFPPNQSATALGWSSAIASYGGFVIPAMFGLSYEAGNPQAILYGLAAYYLFCGVLNYWFYLRSACERKGV